MYISPNNTYWWPSQDNAGNGRPSNSFTRQQWPENAGLAPRTCMTNTSQVQVSERAFYTNLCPFHHVNLIMVVRGVETTLISSKFLSTVNEFYKSLKLLLLANKKISVFVTVTIWKEVRECTHAQSISTKIPSLSLSLSLPLNGWDNANTALNTNQSISLSP